jgi:hypothetical protein
MDARDNLTKLLALTKWLEVVWIIAHSLARPCYFPFGSSILRPRIGKAWASETCAKILARPRIGWANLGLNQTCPYNSLESSNLASSDRF